MTTQHAPSPWTVSGKQVKSIDHGKRYTVATANNPKFTAEANASNARLIAAAPELLATLQNCVNVLALALPLFDDESNDDKDSRDEVESVVDQARAAIAKATGDAA